MIWIPMTAKDRLDTRLPIGFATHPFRPSRNLGELANPFEPKLPPAFRFMTRGLGTKETRSNDLLSLLMFQPDYLKALIDVGCTDAEARQDEIAALLSRF
jgi:NTE family protein